MRKGILLYVLILGSVIGSVGQGKSSTVEATLNGLHLVFDAASGGILKMSHAATGSIIETPADSAGILDLAYPVKEFEPLRLAPRYSKNAQITKDEGKVIIHWDQLGASRSFVKYAGKVSATVIFKANPDGQTVSITCKVKNGTERPIPQIVFPDFFGIVPFNGLEETEFRTGGTMLKPFVDLVAPERDQFFSSNGTMRKFRYGFVLDGRGPVIKWMDIGGRKSGLSIHSKDWGVNGGFSENIYLKLSELSQKLRYLHTLSQNIEPGQEWESAEFVLNAHANGWAEGIKPYRAWAKQNINRIYPLPAHIRDGLGFRTIWMSFTFYTQDPKSKIFSFNDLPGVAREAKSFGLDELVLWGWYDDGFTLPLPPPNPTLGTEREMMKAFAECRKIGVNPVPFISVMTAGPKTAHKYGVQNNAEYNFDVDFLPMGNPSYAKAQKGATIVPSSNKVWQEEVLSSLKKLIDSGITSIGWDQYFNVGPGRYLDTVTTKIRAMAKAKDPESTFSGEVGTNMENECDYLDYSWNWDYQDNADYRPVLSSLVGGPRINVNIDRSALATKTGFADNYFLNIYPRKKDAVNGSDMIGNHPELARALKQCGRLRKQFLKYFVDGTFIADCILPREADGLHVSAYTLSGAMMVVVVNKKEKRPVNLEAVLSPWLASGKGKYLVKEYNDGKLTRPEFETGSDWKQKIASMDRLGIYIYEIAAR